MTLALTSQVLGWLLITASLPRLPAALTSLLLTVQPIGSVALGALIFGESPTGLQLAGVACWSCSAALALIASRRRALPEQVLGLGPDQRRRARPVLDRDVTLGAGDDHDRLQASLARARSAAAAS